MPAPHQPEFRQRAIDLARSKVESVAEVAKGSTQTRVAHLSDGARSPEPAFTKKGAPVRYEVIGNRGGIDIRVVSSLAVKGSSPRTRCEQHGSGARHRLPSDRRY